VAVAFSVIALAYAVAQFAFAWSAVSRIGMIGYDADLYFGFAQRWLATGEYYAPVQLAGPYPPLGQVMLYPPISLYLFLPMSFVPRVMWWAIPLAILSWHLWQSRPAWWTWPFLAIAATLVPTTAKLIFGNSDLWAAAAVALACRWPAASVTLIAKPSLFPIALLFARHERWWLGLAIAGFLSVPFGALWVDWFAAYRNVEGPTLLYSLYALPFVTWPILAWVGRTTHRAPVTADTA